MSIDCIKNSFECAGYSIGAVGFALLHPVIGVLAQPVLGVKAIYQGIMINKTWHRTEDKDGVPLNQGSAYMSDKTIYAIEDLPRLEAELERLEYVDKLDDTLKWMKGFAKCIIPVVGLIWAICTELSGNGSIGFGCSGCGAHDAHWTPEEAVNFHIGKLKTQMKQAQDNLETKDVKDLTGSKE